MNSQLRHFAFTYNNYNKHENWFIELNLVLQQLEANYYIWGEEIAPTTGTPHLQGYVQLKKRKYFNQICKLLHGIHITIIKGSSQDNINYCKKLDNKVYEHGEHRDVARGRVKQKEDWAILVDQASRGQLDEIREHNPREYALYYRTWNQIKMDNMEPVEERRTCLWIYGAPGIGKSRAVWNLFPKAYPKMSNKWWDGYRGESEVILDDLGTPVLFDLLKRWTDRYKVIGEVKGLSCALAYDTFVITSNYSIRDLASKGNSEVDEVTIQAIQRRFVEVQALKWDPVEQDTLVLEPRHNITSYLKDLYYQDDSYVERKLNISNNIKNCYNSEDDVTDVL